MLAVLGGGGEAAMAVVLLLLLFLAWVVSSDARTRRLSDLMRSRHRGDER
ncbi:conserved hypothetical protein [Frankia canadensis]|uniref:Uncharacterized protein n=1 Tax=Frankia canadensis TaxID=1836972 RepID=A0A2I2KW30_9ACTN|nr:hypothetical protein [Frankia canadensis]SNQ49865.1 conserved hypothetical protein [Frankia canadensis]SOU57155.1 conserved hypothetical protein [Frankia canadensis]